VSCLSDSILPLTRSFPLPKHPKRTRFPRANRPRPSPFPMPRGALFSRAPVGAAATPPETTERNPPRSEFARPSWAGPSYTGLLVAALGIVLSTGSPGAATPSCPGYHALSTLTTPSWSLSTGPRRSGPPLREVLHCQNNFVRIIVPRRTMVCVHNHGKISGTITSLHSHVPSTPRRPG
jgi:hypothetical protein